MNDFPRSQALRCFITVAREGTVSRAASLMHLTQPAVSLQLKALEESTGLQLFNRTPGGFTLTEAGAALLPLAHKAVSAALDFGTAANALKASQRRTLRVGTILDPEFTRLGPFVRSLTASSQQTEVFLRYGMSDDVLAQIGKGELDVGYYIDATPNVSPSPQLCAERSVEDGKFQLVTLMSYNYRVIAPAEWNDKVLGKDWTDLAALPWLATPPASAHRRLLDDIFRPLGPLPKRVAFTDQEEAMIHFVESGICLSLARDCVLDRITRKRNFVIADKVTLACDLSFACLAARRHEPAIARAFSAMRAVWDLGPAEPVAAAAPAAAHSPALDSGGPPGGLLA
jgi:DNA-binding transcriptional LysR family regulator